MAAAIAAGRSGVHDFVAADMGGTSYDVCLVQNSQPAVATDWNWRHRYYVNLPMVDIHSVGAGGGSIARVRQGALLVGPESAGSYPGRSATAGVACWPPSPTATRRSATCPPRASPAAAWSSTSRPAGPPSRATSLSRWA